jgi:hypothetical protein
LAQLFPFADVNGQPTHHLVIFDSCEIGSLCARACQASQHVRKVTSIPFA